MLDCESIILKAEIPFPIPPARIALLKYKLAFLLDTRFKPAAPPRRPEEIVREEPQCGMGPSSLRRVLRRIEAGELPQFKRSG